eukprot:CAMPEP_0197638954 /NCGR_PEP_ID=MMETSP1338-20131121/13726_1 /TAXON_ID=43686 ORGANISM="Pelagodinium beii, Strain RCC1491" /NCGR_SAMPLE_ID=MMETSP1338 /ASSEMBLY_ACC=CAM_ASM_000754 /LENGTH=137 /DNA_ID=CAMNT_0043211617 /DNA_START=4 /DNA_END=417 /DNA_ORIENTATION=+
MAGLAGSPIAELLDFISLGLLRRSTVSVLHDPPPGEIDALAQLLVEFFGDPVLVMLLSHAFHCAKVSVTKVQAVKILSTLQLKLPRLAQRKRYDAAVLELSLEEVFVVSMPPNRVLPVNVEVQIAAVWPLAWVKKAA